MSTYGRCAFQSAAAAASAILAAVGVIAPAGAQEAPDESLSRAFRAELAPLTASASVGSLALYVGGAEQRIVVEVTDTSPSRPHPIAFHRSDDPAARCPRASDDRNGDGFVTGNELDAVAGPVVGVATQSGSTGPDELFVLETSPAADLGGTMTLDRTVSGADRLSGEFGSVHVVVYGNDLNFSNRYERAGGGTPAEVSIPIACGQLDLASISLPSPYDGAQGAAGIVARLYATILDRAPESAGSAYFISEIDSGAPAIDVVWAMAASPEFESRFGRMLAEPTSAWVDFVYRAVFGRSADTAGRQYWVSQIDRNGLQREAMLFYFADSAEFKRVTGTS